MEIIDNKAVVLRTRDPAKYSIIPKHKILSEIDGVYEVAVYWGLDEARVLKNLGVKDIRSPITGRYNWPGKFTPMDHQIDTSAFLTMNRRAFCFNDPGTGKTLSALWAADFDLVIVDEANAYKNPSTRRWKALATIIKPTTYLWMMTGTPASQSPVDAYGLAKLVNPNGVPKFQTAWRDKVMNKISMFKWAPKVNANDLVFSALQPAVRFTKEQCLDLPPVVTVTREAPMTPQQNKYYKLLKEQMMVSAAGQTISAVNAGVAVNKLLQISCGAAYTDDKEVVVFDAGPRLAVLDEVLEETARKVIIFAMFRSSIDTIVTHLLKRGYGVDQIHGDVSATKRGHIINDFQTQPTIRVLVMQPQATAHGITLTAADTVVFFGPLMSVEMYTQCIARADRKGQNSDKVTVVHIESSPIERRMFKAMEGKVSDHSLLVGMFDHEIKN